MTTPYGKNSADEELARLAQKGDRQAAAELLRRYEPLVARAARQSHLAPVADDAAGEARLALYEAVLSYAPGTGVPFAGYAKAMVYGRLRSFFKKQRRNWQREVMPAAPDEDGADFWDTLADPHDSTEELLRRESVRAALMALPPRQAEIIRALFFAGKTQGETAAALGITQQAVAKAKLKALGRLKALLPEE